MKIINDERSGKEDDIMKIKEKDLYRENLIKKSQKRGNSNAYDLEKEIEVIRNKLNGKLSQKNKILISAEILELSQKLDELIVLYIKNI